MTRSRPTKHATPLVVTLLVVTSGMAFSFLWLRLTQTGFYHGYWMTPEDLWSSYRTAHWVGWGAYGSLYGATGSYLTFPGVALLLAPLAVLTRAFGLSEGFPYMIPHPTAWLLLGPIEMLLGCSSLFALDTLGGRLGVKTSRRWIVCTIQGFALWPILVLWGHPEDAVSLALAVYALINIFDRRWTRAGWLFGAAVCFQPLALLLLPLCISRVGMRNSSPFVSRSLGPSVTLLIVPFLSDWRETWRAVVTQPTEIAYAHVTPWTSIAPRLASGFVECGPTRLVAIIGAVLLGCYTARRRSDDLTLVYCALLCLALRFVSESALEGYYIWPVVALLLLVGSAGSRSKFLVTGSLAIGITVVTSRHFGPWWIWWGVAVLGLVLAAVISRPRSHLSNEPEPVTVVVSRSQKRSDGATPGPLPRVLEPI